MPRAATDGRPRLLSAAVQPRQGRVPAGKQIPGHVTPPNIKNYASCGNPTFTNGKNVLLANAPFPNKCQKLGAPLNCVIKNGKAVNANGGGGGGDGGGGGGGGSGGSGKGSSGSGGGGGGSGGSGNPALGGTTGTGTTTGASNVSGSVVSLAANGTDRALLAVLTALAVVAAVGLPPAVGAWLRRRKGQAGA